MKYKVKYWINVDMLAEEIVEAENIDVKNNNLGQFKEPSKNATYTVMDTIKINRRTFEEHDKKPNDSIKKRTSNK